MPGQAPQKSAIRANARPDWVTLPAAGRAGPAPAWPIPGAAKSGPMSRWRYLWALPQAVEWERLHLERVVARYVLSLDWAEKTLSAPILAEVRQMEDRLGLSPMALKRLQWEIAPVEPKDGVSPSGVTSIDAYRDL
jgi:hypothetical protein